MPAHEGLQPYFPVLGGLKCQENIKINAGFLDNNTRYKYSYGALNVGM